MDAGRGTPAGVGEYIAALLASAKMGDQVTHHRLLPGAEPVFAPSRLPWPRAIGNLLEERGVRLYSHQALATDHIRAGHSVVVATPTASGKSLIYNLPVLERHLHDPDARALYLFPLKALAQDQLAAFTALTATWPEAARPTAALYDGDTSDHFRRKIRRDPPTVLVSNPEMLHLGILPHHEQWAAFLAGLTHVVVDEAHTYRGVFGAHMAQVFRRLNRLAGRYGARPTYVLCTATVGNPGELASGLIGAGDSAPVVVEEPDAMAETPRPADAPVVIDTSGAPQGPRHFVFLNPEQSPATAAIDLLKAALARNLRTIVYCRSRRMTELVSLWAGSRSGPYKERISAYRAGFLPEERRSIEARMASGELLAVVSTSALELGIDIGGLDVCILVGYPGTVMATLQRGGRVGRAQQESAVIVVAGEDALDQYFARNPEDFFSRPPEKAVVNPDNEVILARHLECAAAELPLSADEPWLHSAGARRAVRELRKQSLLLQSADGRQWLAARKRPQRLVDLRGTGQSYSIEDQEGAVIGSVDGFRAWRETHPGAVYLHRGRTYVIEEVDPGRAGGALPAFHGLHPRSGARNHRPVALAGHGRPQRLRRHFHSAASPDGTALRFRLRRPARRRGPHPPGLCRSAGTAGSHAPCCGGLPLRGRLPLLRAFAQMRLGQPAHQQTGRSGPAGRTARAGRRRRRPLPGTANQPGPGTFGRPPE